MGMGFIAGFSKLAAAVALLWIVFGSGAGITSIFFTLPWYVWGFLLLMLILWLLKK